jgi:cold shock CspA family protein
VHKPVTEENTLKKNQYRMADSWNKKEREKKKQQNKKEKIERKKERKEYSGSRGPESMIAYIDENGNLTSTPPDRTQQRREYNLEDIEISVPRQRPVDPEDLIRSGAITFFNDAKGFGFITDEKSGERVFVHISALLGPAGEGTKVTYEVEMGPKGANAVNVTPVS